MFRKALVAFTALAALTLTTSGPATAQSQNELFDRCMQGEQAACDAWFGVIDDTINRTLDPIDPPELRELRYRCQAGDVRACEEETARRGGIIRGYQRGIDSLNQMYGPSWQESFGLGGD